MFVELPYRPTAAGSRARRVFQQYRQVQRVSSREWPLGQTFEKCLCPAAPFAAVSSLHVSVMVMVIPS